MTKQSAFLVIVLLAMTTIATADTISISRFAVEGFSGWEKEKFQGETEYRLLRDGRQTVVMAHSRSAASGMLKKMQVDPAKYRYLNWSWKVGGMLKSREEKSKAGDDYRARVYVIFPGTFFWQTRAINYVWAGHLAKEESFPNPFTRNAMMVVVESGAEKNNTWVTEQRDILADYRRLFGEEPRQIGAVAFMTDTDNSGGETTSWYGDIYLSSQP